MGWLLKRGATISTFQDGKKWMKSRWLASQVKSDLFLQCQKKFPAKEDDLHHFFKW
jgi:hypothetical protein